MGILLGGVARLVPGAFSMAGSRPPVGMAERVERRTRGRGADVIDRSASVLQERNYRADDVVDISRLPDGAHVIGTGTRSPSTLRTVPRQQCFSERKSLDQ